MYKRQPKHETYLKPGQAISFYLESDYKPDAVHLGAKVASGSNLNLGLYLMNKENGVWTPYNCLLYTSKLYYF